jgi:hypothetical protein
MELRGSSRIDLLKARQRALRMILVGGFLSVLCLVVSAGCDSKQQPGGPPQQAQPPGFAPFPAPVPGGELMTAERFRQIASSPADATPLSPKLAAVPGLMWTNAAVNVLVQFPDGRIFTNDVIRTAKYVGGKYVIFTVRATPSDEPMDSIVSYDEKASAYKVWGISGNAVSEQTLVFDFEKRIYATSSGSSDGFSALGIGYFNETNDVEHASIFRNGVLFITREARTTPR